MRRWLVFIVIVLICLGLAAAQGADGTTLTIPPLDVEAGSNPTYEIKINCLADGCIAFDITLSFDPALIRIDDVQVGPYMGEDVFIVRSTIDREMGRLRLAAAALGELSEMQESVLLRIGLTALGSGKATFSVDHLDISDRSGLPVDFEILDVEPVSTPVPSAVPVPPVTCEYVVRTGDTMTGIALANSVTIEAIMTLNNIADARFIYVGQKLQIPSSNCVSGLTGGGSGQQRPGGARYFDVWDCRHLGSNVFEWYGVEVSYDSAGNPISERRVDGPHTGEWRPGCPAGERPQGGGSGGGGDDDDGGSPGGNPTIRA